MHVQVQTAGGDEHPMAVRGVDASRLNEVVCRIAFHGNNSASPSGKLFLRAYAQTPSGGAAHNALSRMWNHTKRLDGDLGVRRGGIDNAAGAGLVIRNLEFAETRNRANN